MSAHETTTYGASDAQSHFPVLLKRVAAGEAITITDNGQAVAQLIPLPPQATELDRRQAIAAMRLLAGRNTLSDLRLKDLIAEGRK